VQRLKAIAKRSKWLVVAVSIAKDQWARWAARRGPAPSTSGATHESLPVDQSLAYINAVFRDYLRYGQLQCSNLRGRRILELGPGDNYGVALHFLACGAARVTLVDRFATRRDQAHQARIYQALLDSLDERRRASIGDAIRLDGGIMFDQQRLHAMEGVTVEDLEENLEPGTFDLVVSRAVLEHVADPDRAMAAIDQMLAPGGLMLHKVDFRDHGMFSTSGAHPLTFLTIPERLYRLMSRNSGRPNRRLMDWYRAKLASLDYEAQLLVTKLVGMNGEVEPHVERISLDSPDGRRTRELVRSIRPRLRPTFRELDDVDLGVAGIFIVARKRGSRPVLPATERMTRVRPAQP
jgi:SAM-dependent methyltransferase